MYRYNPNVKYRAGNQTDENGHTNDDKMAFDLQNLVHPNVYTSSNTYFKTSYRDITQQVEISIPLIEVFYNEFIFGPKKYYQNQLSFALWLSTTGCGISKEMLLSQTEPLQQSILIFHAYYQTRRFLKRMKVPLPNEPFFNQENNYYDPSAYESICDEFNISKNDSFRIKISEIIPVDILLKKIPLVPNELKQFIIDKANGLTQPGVRYLNDSIRTYSWLILGSQAQTRTTIIGLGKELDAQHQYLKNLEAAIAREEDLSKSISDYQDTLKYARSKLDYVIAYGCYMCPSNMNLKIGTVNDYNNMIQEATDDMKIGVNTQINSDIKKNIIPVKSTSNSSAATTNTTQTSLKNSLNTPTQTSLKNSLNTPTQTSLKNSLNTPIPTTDTIKTVHYDKKDIIMAGAIGLILFLYIF